MYLHGNAVSQGVFMAWQGPDCVLCFAFLVRNVLSTLKTLVEGATPKRKEKSVVEKNCRDAQRKRVLQCIKLSLP